MKRLFIEKGSSNWANKVLEVGLWVSYIFGLKQNFEERVLGIEILSKVVSKKTREKQKLNFFFEWKTYPMVLGLLYEWFS